MLLTDVVIPAFATLFVVIDPVGLVPIFLAVTAGGDERQRAKIALRANITAFFILVLFAVLGKSVLSVLGIGLPAFRIAGGIMLFMIALEMLFERRSRRRQRNAASASAESAEHPETKLEDDVAYFPLGIPLIAGPGAIAAMILLNSQHQGDYLAQGAVVGVMVLVLAITLVLFLLGTRLERFAGATFTNVVTRLLGVILGALAVQFVLSGLGEIGLIPGS